MEKLVIARDGNLKETFTTTVRNWGATEKGFYYQKMNFEYIEDNKNVLVEVIKL